MSKEIENIRAAYQEVLEKLKGSQHKLDHDGDGDIDGKDFAMLRNKKKKKTDEDTSASADKKPEKYHDEEGKEKTRMVPTKKKKKDKNEGDIDMNPKLEKGSSQASEQKESTIRSRLMSIWEKAGDKHSPNAKDAETMDDKLKGKGAKDMVNQPKEVDDTETKGHDDASKAGRVTKPAKQRNGGDQVRSGDQKPVNAIAAAYKSMK